MVILNKPQKLYLKSYQLNYESTYIKTRVLSYPIEKGYLQVYRVLLNIVCLQVLTLDQTKLLHIFPHCGTIR